MPTHHGFHPQSFQPCDYKIATLAYHYFNSTFPYHFSASLCAYHIMPLLQTVHCVPSLRQYTPLLPFSFAMHIPYYHNYAPLIDSTLRTVTSTLHSRLTCQLRSAHTILYPTHRQYIAYRHFDSTLPSYLSASLCTYHIMPLS